MNTFSRYLLVAALALLWAPLLLLGDERLVTEHNCAITPPAGWERSEAPPGNPAVVRVFHRPDRKELIMLVVDDKNLPGELTEKSMAEIERGLVAGGGGARISSRVIQIGGLKALERKGTLTANDLSATTFSYMIPTGSKNYSLQAMRFDGNAWDDPELVRSMESFRFLSPPAPPRNTGSVAYRLGQIVGGLACVVGVLLVIALVIYLVWRVSRRKKATPPNLPI